MSYARGRGVDPKIMLSNEEKRRVCFVPRKHVLLVRNNECSWRKTIFTFEMLRPDV